MTTLWSPSGNWNVVVNLTDNKRNIHMEEQKLPSQHSYIPEDLKIDKLIAVDFDCKICGGDCIRRRICCDGKGKCKLLVMLDTKILFWCGSENETVTRKQFCENVVNANPEKIEYGVRSNVTVLTFCGESFRFHAYGETHFYWPNNEDYDSSKIHEDYQPSE